MRRSLERRRINGGKVRKYLFLALSLAALIPATASAGSQEIDPSYANGQTVYMIGPHLIVGAQPNLLAQSADLYLLAYPTDLTGGAPLTLPSGYQPQCNPCFHPGLPKPFVYHDHVLSGSPGFGNDGTAGVFKGPWEIIVMMYSPATVNSPTFQPIKNAADIDAAEAAHEFLPVPPAAGTNNPYEFHTGNVLICPLVSSHA